MRGNDATDLQTLAALAREPDIRDMARGRSRVRLLWDACQIPDFRKIADDSHVRLCAKVFGHVVRDGGLPADWIAGQVAALSRADGDIDTLMQRLTGVRVWSYIAARTDWVRDAPHWQARAREVEDLLSDALHERLTTRFVDRRAAVLMRRLEAGDAEELFSTVTTRGEVVVEGHSVGHVEGFAFVPDPASAGDERKLVLRAARRALREEMPRRLARLEAADDAALEWRGDHRLAWDGTPVARLRRGASLLAPQVEPLSSEFLDGPMRERLRLRLQGFVERDVAQALSPLLLALAAAGREPALRGPLHLLRETAGVMPPAGQGAAEQELAPALRGRLKALGVRAGRFGWFMPALLKPAVAAVRARLWALWHEASTPALPAAGLVALAPPPDWPDGFASAMGWQPAGPVLLRRDVAERVAADLAWTSRGRRVPLPAGLASRLSVRAEQLPPVLHALGLKLFPAELLAAGQYGPPAPAMFSSLRQRVAIDVAAPARVPQGSGPFAALAALRR